MKPQRGVKLLLYSIFNLDARLGGWLRPRLATLHPGITRYPLYRSVGGPQGHPGWLEKISPLRKFDPPTIQHVAIQLPYFSNITFARAREPETVRIGRLEMIFSVKCSPNDQSIGWSRSLLLIRLVAGLNSIQDTDLSYMFLLLWPVQVVKLHNRPQHFLLHYFRFIA